MLALLITALVLAIIGITHILLDGAKNVKKARINNEISKDLGEIMEQQEQHRLILVNIQYCLVLCRLEYPGANER